MKDIGQNELMGTPRMGSLQQCLNDERKSPVARMDPKNLDDRNVMPCLVSETQWQFQV